MKPENMVGKMCVDTHGRIGVVKSFREDSQGILYEGNRVFGGGPWRSRRPLILNGSDARNIEGKDSPAERPESPPERVEVSEPRLNLNDAPRARRRRSKKSTDDDT